MKMLEQKKGFVQDAITIIVLLFSVALIFIVALQFFSGLSQGLNQSLTTPETARGLAIAEQTNEDAGWVFDFIFAMLFISLPIASMILAFFNDIPSFFFWGSLGIVFLVIIFGGAFAEAWSSAGTDPVFGLQVQRMPITDIIMSNFGIYALFVVVIILAGTFVKTRSYGGF